MSDINSETFWPLQVNMQLTNCSQSVRGIWSCFSMPVSRTHDSTPENGPGLGGSYGHTTQVANVLNENITPSQFLDVIAPARLQGSSFSSSKTMRGTTFVPFSANQKHQTTWL